MEFNTAIKTVQAALKECGTIINPSIYDGIIVKKLVASNTLDEGRTTNQTHIAITGPQLSMFPYISCDGYLNNVTGVLNDSLKKYFYAKVPVFLNKENCDYLGVDISDNKFTNGYNETSVCVVRSKRSGQADQIQLSLIDKDGSNFVEFRRKLHIDYLIIFLKLKGKFNYHVFGIKPVSIVSEESNLAPLNNQFFYNQSETAINVDALSPENIFESNNGSKTKGGLNLIYYGAPGCGKSRLISDMLKDAAVSSKNIIRVTFHPEYANCDFAGQILPTVQTKVNKATGEKKDVVNYVFNPGPFTLALQTAYNTNNMVYLIIEEINRGNAASIFGDLFQLLDREKDVESPNYSASEYPICNINMQRYLSSVVTDESIKESLKTGIYIPSNLTILATMNSSDQNVFTLDTAFKRRWDFEQISNNIKTDTTHKYKNWFIPGTSVTWETFLTVLNDKILDYKIQSQTNEDKRLGKYFVSKDCLSESQYADPSIVEKKKQFAYKVLEYIWNDVCKIGREDWFNTDKYKTLEDLIDAFTSIDNPLDVFENITF